VRNVPISITVLPQQAIEDAGINSLEGVAALTPNFSTFPTGGSNLFTTYSVRGLGNSNFLSRDAVGFYVDDVPYDYGAFIDFNLFDLERAEVLRGPQSTLYGRNSQSGVVNLTTRPPSNKPELRVGGSYGNYNQRTAQISYSDAIVRDRLAFRVSGGYQARDGFYNNSTLDRSVGGLSKLNGRGQLLWTPSPDWTVSLQGTANTNRDKEVGFVLLTDPAFTTRQNFEGFNNVDTNTQALKVTHTGVGFNATAITTRRFSTQDFESDLDNTPADNFRRVSTYDSTLWSQELRVQSPANGDKLRWLFGGYFESRDFNVLRDGISFNSTGAALFGRTTPGFNRTSAELNQSTYAAFGQVDYQPIRPLTISAGLRYESSTTKMNKRSAFLSADNTIVLPTGLPFNNIQTTNSDILPRLAVQYQVDRNLSAYGSITKGYRPGGLNYQANVPTELRYQPESSWNYEVGLKSSWMDDRLAANLSLFSNSVGNYQVLTPGLPGLGASISNAEVMIQGLELEVRSRPVPGLEVSAGLGYVNGRFKNYTNPTTGQSFNGNRLPYSPDLTYNIAVQHRSPGGLFARAELRGSGNYSFRDDNILKQAPFATVNTRIGYEQKDYGVYLFANNLFDARYLTAASQVPIFGTIGSYGEPATYGIQVRADF
jgi:iron complex outermembrane recepter protein